MAALSRKLRRPLFLLALYAGDAAAPLAAFCVAYLLRYENVPFAATVQETLSNPRTQLLLLLVTVFHVFVLRLAGIYKLHKPWLPMDLALRVVLASFATALLFYALAHAQRTELVSRALLLYFLLVLLTVMFSLKLLARAFVLALLCVGIGEKRTAIVGSTETARRLLRTLRQHPYLGYRVVGVLYRGGHGATPPDLSATDVREGSALVAIRSLLDLEPHVVIIATSAQKNDDLMNLIGSCTSRGIEVRLVPEFYELYSTNLQIDQLGVTPMVRLRSPAVPVTAAAAKRAFDLAGAVLLLPVLGLAMLRLRARARRRGVALLVTDERAGRGGRPFGLYGFHDALWLRGGRQDGSAPGWANVLPQALNVLRGDMSLVGPRARNLDRAAHYNSWEKRILAVRPGIVGFGGPNESVQREDLADQLMWDTSYLDHASLAFDLNVLFEALPQFFSQHPVRAADAG